MNTPLYCGHYAHLLAGNQRKIALLKDIASAVLNVILLGSIMCLTIFSWAFID